MDGLSAIWPPQGGGHSPLYVWVDRLSRLLAALGGIVIFGVAVTVSISVVMRNLGLSGVRGDFELVEMSCAVAAGCFLPLAQLNLGHVKVDLFTGFLPLAARMMIDRIWSLCFALGWAALAYATVHGLLEIRDYGDRTMMLSIPVWWAFVPAVFGAAASSLIALAQTFTLQTASNE